tara:strand:+ start:248 stop:1111 length:864 start_codon:yes stop_codon:yes gene_type:complete
MSFIPELGSLKNFFSQESSNLAEKDSLTQGALFKQQKNSYKKISKISNVSTKEGIHHIDLDSQSNPASSEDINQAVLVFNQKRQEYDVKIKEYELKHQEYTNFLKEQAQLSERAENKNSGNADDCRPHQIHWIAGKVSLEGWTRGAGERAQGCNIQSNDEQRYNNNLTQYSDSRLRELKDELSTLNAQLIEITSQMNSQINLMVEIDATLQSQVSQQQQEVTDVSAALDSDRTNLMNDKPSPTLDTVDGLYNDSELKSTWVNYEYMAWVLGSITIIGISLNQIRKSN